MAPTPNIERGSFNIFKIVSPSKIRPRRVRRNQHSAPNITMDFPEIQTTKDPINTNPPLPLLCMDTLGEERKDWDVMSKIQTIFQIWTPLFWTKLGPSFIAGMKI